MQTGSGADCAGMKAALRSAPLQILSSSTLRSPASHHQSQNPGSLVLLSWLRGHISSDLQGHISLLLLGPQLWTPPPLRARTFSSFLLFLEPNYFFIHLKLEVINIYFSKEMGNILSIRPSLPEADSCRPVLECSAPQAPVRGSYIFVGMSKNPGFSGTGRCL